MANNASKKARQYYHSLSGLEDIFRSSMKTSSVIRAQSVALLASELERLEKDLPGLVPQEDLSLHRYDHEHYHAEGILSVLMMVLGRLKVAIETAEAAPVTDKKEFPFVKDPNLRKILQRDYIEIQKCFVVESWKAVIILAGGILEGILLDLLLHHEIQAKSSSKAQKDAEIKDWGLVYLILVAVDLKLISPGADKFSHAIRQYRDLVHPIVEIESGLKLNQEEAKIAIEILNIVYRDLSG